MTLSPKTDNTGVTFKTLSTGAPTIAGPSILRFLAEGANIMGDNFADVAGFPLTQSESDKLVFRIEAKIALDGSIALTPPGTIFFKQNTTANGDVSIEPSIADMTLDALMIADADGSNPQPSKNWDGLTLSVDSNNKKILFSGIPTTMPPASQTYKVQWYVGAGMALSTDLKVEIIAQDISTMSLDKARIDLTEGILADASIDLALSPNDDFSALIVSDDQSLAGAILWNGLTISADIADKKIFVKGTPTNTGVREVAVSGDVTGKKVTPSYLSFTINVHDSLNNATLLVAPPLLVLPAGVPASAKIDLIFAPLSLDLNLVKPVIFKKGDPYVNDGQGHYAWSGLDIQAMWLSFTQTAWLAISGDISMNAKEDFTIAFERNGDVLSADFTISSDIPLPSPSGVLNPPTLYDKDDHIISTGTAGDLFKAVYSVSGDVPIKILTVAIQPPGASSAKALPPLIDSAQGGDSFSFDSPHGRLSIFNTPPVPGQYIATIYYELSGKLYALTSPIWVRAAGAGDNCSGGCSAGISPSLFVLFCALAGLHKRKR